MDSAEIMTVGAAIETMTQLEGWKFYETWLNDREKEYLLDLRKSKSWEDTIRLQARLEMIDTTRVKIREWINNKNRELKNQKKDRS